METKQQTSEWAKSEEKFKIFSNKWKWKQHTQIYEIQQKKYCVKFTSISAYIKNVERFQIT